MIFIFFDQVYIRAPVRLRKTQSLSLYLKMSFLVRPPSQRMPKPGKPVELQSIAQINGLPTFQNDPDGVP